ncbi:MAG: hypothetical protein AAB608_01775 [Patescibacteria group bacterium]
MHTEIREGVRLLVINPNMPMFGEVFVVRVLPLDGPEVALCVREGAGSNAPKLQFLLPNSGHWHMDDVMIVSAHQLPPDDRATQALKDVRATFVPWWETIRAYDRSPETLQSRKAYQERILQQVWSWSEKSAS